MIKFDHPFIKDNVILDNQKEINCFLIKNNFSITVSKDLGRLKDVIESQSEDNYPYTFDKTFGREYLGDAEFFCIFLKHKNNIIGTYAARKIILENYLYDLRNYFSNDVVSANVKLDNLNVSDTWYSSLQWVSNDHRGKNIGLILDYIKKSIIFEKFNGNINFSTHAVALNEYHKNKLMYNNTEWFMTIINGKAGRESDLREKIYNISYIDKNEWNKVKNEVYNLYI